MGMFDKGAPDAPDYKGAAGAQAGAQTQATNQQTAANRPNQYTPWGSSTWNQTGGQFTGFTTGPNGMPVAQYAPQSWEQHTTLDPRLQGSLDSQMGLQQDRSKLAASMFGQAQDAMSQPFSFNGMPTATAFDGSLPQSLQPFDMGSLSSLPQLDKGALSKLNVLDPSSVGSLPDLQHLDSPETGMAARDKAESALYGRATSRLDPEWNQREQQMRSQLANQGIDPNSAAGQKAMDDFGRQRNDAYSRARQDSIAGGGQEQQLQFGMGLQGNQQQLMQQQMAQMRALQNAGLGLQAQGQAYGEGLQGNEQALREEAQRYGQTYGANQQQMGAQAQRYGQGYNANEQAMGAQRQKFGQGMQARQQAIMEALQKRQQPMMDINSLLGGQGVSMPTMPGFSMAGMGGVPQWLQAAIASGNFGLSAAGLNGQTAGDLGSGVASILGLSDARAKKNIERLPVEAEKGVPFALFEYKHDPGKKRLGVIAQDLEKVKPQAVRTGRDGLKRVDYSQVRPFSMAA